MNFTPRQICIFFMVKEAIMVFDVMSQKLLSHVNTGKEKVLKS